jgi:riboflavin kinase/FMN adenylyltransferase
VSGPIGNRPQAASLPHKGSVLTIGNFDGVHAGHRHLLRRVIELGRERHLKPAVLTFDPHPTRIVAPHRAPRLLTSIEERIALIREVGVEEVVVLPFTLEVARLSPEEFVERIVVGQLHGRIVMVGDNFRFGHKQAGDVNTLSELGLRFGFETHTVDAVRRRGRVVSSSEIRRLIEQGNVAMAGRLLERPYDLCGDVVSGHGIGSKQTVPTLNLRTPAEVIPAEGVYITRTRDLEAGERWDSITNVGTRPTFGGGELTIETFLLSSFDGLTPERVSLEFLRRVREERTFENAEALKQQILRDVGRAQTFFRRLGLH